MYKGRDRQKKEWEYMVEEGEWLRTLASTLMMTTTKPLITDVVVV